MINMLCTTRLIYLEEYLFFRTETEGILGKICLENGHVHFLNSVPERLLGEKTHGGIMYGYDNSIYIISNKGKDICELSSDGNFSRIEFENEKDKKNINAWAGVISFSNKIYAFGRDDGWILKIDTRNKKASYGNTRIADRIMWASKYNDIVYAISWDCNYLYRYDLNTGEVVRLQMKIENLAKIESKSSIPLHGMCSDNGMLYFHDSNKIFKYDIISNKTTILNRNESEDNGSRIIILDNIIIVPSMNQKHFYIIEKESGIVQGKKNITTDAKIADGWNGSGEPCYTDNYTYLPIINSNMILQINNINADCEWIMLNFDKKDIERVMLNTMQKNVIVKESSIYSVSTFLKNLQKW